MKKLIYALRFMTVLPIPWKEDEDLDEVARAISFFPLVGAVIGLLLASVYLLTSLLFSPLLCAVFVLVCWVAITGGLHLDGLADTADGVWGGTTVKRRLEIMKDSRIGAFGVLTLILFLMLKAVVLSEIFGFYGPVKIRALISAPIIGRTISVVSIYFFATARKDGLGFFFKERTGKQELIIASVISCICLLFSGWIVGLIALAVSILLLIPSALFFKGKLGGLTGDVYGAFCEGAEFLTLLVMLLFV